MPSLLLDTRCCRAASETQLLLPSPGGRADPDPTFSQRQHWLRSQATPKPLCVTLGGGDGDSAAGRQHPAPPRVRKGRRALGEGAGQAGAQDSWRSRERRTHLAAHLGTTPAASEPDAPGGRRGRPGRRLLAQASQLAASSGSVPAPSPAAGQERCMLTAGTVPTAPVPMAPAHGRSGPGLRPHFALLGDALAGFPACAHPIS